MATIITAVLLALDTHEPPANATGYTPTGEEKRPHPGEIVLMVLFSAFMIFLVVDDYFWRRRRAEEREAQDVVPRHFAAGSDERV